MLIWVKKMSSSLIDDLLSIQYSLVFDKPSPYGTSTFSYISIICTGVISAIGAASMSYDVYAASAFALICAANLIMGVFLKLYKSKTELAVYDGKSA